MTSQNLLDDFYHNKMIALCFKWLPSKETRVKADNFMNYKTSNGYLATRLGTKKRRKLKTWKDFYITEDRQNIATFSFRS
jgi:hypothetical protein